MVGAPGARPMENLISEMLVFVGRESVDVAYQKKICRRLFNTFINRLLGLLGCEEPGTEDDIGENRCDNNECDKDNCCFKTREGI